MKEDVVLEEEGKGLEKKRLEEELWGGGVEGGRDVEVVVSEEEEDYIRIVLDFINKIINYKTTTLDWDIVIAYSGIQERKEIFCFPFNTY